MRSLRARLILGISLIALLPLAITTTVLSRRVEAIVRAQAEERLKSAFASLEAGLSSEQRDIEEKLIALARDPVLRRLYLVPTDSGAQQLSEYLAERRTLLGLDVLLIADLAGKPVAMEVGGDSAGVSIHYTTPIYYENKQMGELGGGRYIDSEFLMKQKRATGVDFVLAGSGSPDDASTFPDSMTIPPLTSPGMTRVSTKQGSFIADSFQPFPGSGFTTPLIFGYVSTASSDRAIATLKLTSLALAIVGLSLAVLLGILWSSQVSRPVEQLADFSRKVADGKWEEPLQIHSIRELETLVTALDRMRRDLRDYRERLVTSERHAAWSQMSRKVAHEIKNPLTPIAVSVADLKRSYEQNRQDFPAILDQAVRTIGEEVERLKRMLNEFSEFGRLPPPKFERCNINDLFTDLGTLYAGDLRAGRLDLEPGDPHLRIEADPAQLRQALVNLLQNGLDAIDGTGQVKVALRSQDGDLLISVSDNGPGLTAENKARLFSPGFTTKPGGSGLGLLMVERIVNDHQGTIDVVSEPGRGTTFTLRLPRERQHGIHPDRG